jgi:hypothetical protein
MVPSILRQLAVVATLMLQVVFPVSALSSAPETVRQSLTPPAIVCHDDQISRRSMVFTSARVLLGSLVVTPSKAAAKADCLQDCIKNCKQIVPNDTSNYCRDTCTDYCIQPDRTDGLSGSVSSEGGEVGILGGTFGTGTVVKGEDKPPSIDLPGLDFKTSEGKKLIGL